MSRESWEQIINSGRPVDIDLPLPLEIPPELSIPETPVPAPAAPELPPVEIRETPGSRPAVSRSKPHTIAAVMPIGARKPGSTLRPATDGETQAESAPARPGPRFAAGPAKIDQMALAGVSPAGRENITPLFRALRAVGDPLPAPGDPLRAVGDPLPAPGPPVAGSTPVVAADSSGAPSLGLEEAPATVLFRVAEWTPGTAVRQIRVMLEPAELGGVRVHLRQRGTGLFARVVVERAAALPLVTAHFATLRAALAQRGVDIAGFSITAATAAASAGAVEATIPGGGSPARRPGGRTRTPGQENHRDTHEVSRT